MILTVTCNPAVDKTYRVEKLLTGQVNRTKSFVQIAGGKGINVSKIIHLFGEKTFATGFLGGYTGEFIEERLSAMGILHEFQKIAAQTRTNMNFLGEDGQVTEILEPGPDLFEEERKGLEALFERLLHMADLVVLSGSLPETAGIDFYKKLIYMSRKQGVKVILDTSGAALACGLEAEPNVIKPNIYELEQLLGGTLGSKKEIIQGARTLLKGDLEIIAVSMGKEGLLVIDEKEAYWGKPPEIKAVNTVGCGDCVVASLAMDMCRDTSKILMCRNAVAISAANACTLENGVVEKQVVRQMQEQVEIIKEL